MTTGVLSPIVSMTSPDVAADAEHLMRAEAFGATVAFVYLKQP